MKFDLERVPSYRVDNQVIDTQTHTHTHGHTQTQAMTIPEGQNWPRVKSEQYKYTDSKVHWADVGPAYQHQISNIRHILVRNKLVDHSDVVGPSPVGVAPTTSSFST